MQTLTWLVVVLARSCSVDCQEAPANWFETGSLPELVIELDEQAADSLRDKPRRWVNATLMEKGSDPMPVAVKLKGSAGSFREFDDKPGLTVDVNRVDRKQAFHGLVKFHLNNAVQDETYLQEYLAYEVFRLCGLPAPRVTHARVWIGKKDLGLYVLKEGYDRRFLKRVFTNDPDGNLYDGGVNGDVEDELDRDVGRGPLDYRDLKALAKACRLEPGPERRKQLEECLDVDQFITFMAAEVMIGHWDGYTLNPNNYRVYFPRRTRKAAFIIHGADQVFQEPDAELFQDASGRVAREVLSESIWKDAYRERMRKLLPVFDPPRLLKLLDKKADRLRPLVSRTMSKGFARRLDRHQAGLKERVMERAAYLAAAVHGNWPKPLEIPKGGITLSSLFWRRQSDCDDAIFEGNDGTAKTPFQIRTGGCGHCNASWRTSVLLPRGTYELSARMTTKGVVLSDEEYNPGAGVRISGKEREWIEKGSATNKPVSFTFEIEDDPQEVVLVIELRSAKGEVTFPKESLRLRRK